MTSPINIVLDKPFRLKRGHILPNEIIEIPINIVLYLI